MQTFIRVSNNLAKFEKMSIGVLLIIMSILAILQVVTRYLFLYSISWLEELTRYLMIWMTFVGAALAVQKKANIGVDIVPVLTKNKIVVGFFNLLVNAITAVFACAYFFYSLSLVNTTLAFSQLTPAMRIPMYLMYASISVGALLMIVHSLANTLLDWRKMKEE